jgi:hypothetical protein
MKALLPSALALLVLVGCAGSDDEARTEETQSNIEAAATSAAAPGAMKSGAYIEYTVTGDVEVSNREEEVVLCSETSDGFKAHTIGDWNFSLDADGSGPGSHGVRFMVAAPPEIQSVRAAGRDHRFYGDGTLTLEDAGKDNVGFDAVRVTFTGTGLESDPGYRISVEGSFFCGVM